MTKNLSAPTTAAARLNGKIYSAILTGVENQKKFRSSTNTIDWTGM